MRLLEDGRLWRGGFAGAAPEGLRGSGALEPDGVLDLLDPELWRRPKRPFGDEFRAPAVVALIALVGATLAEALRLTRGQWEQARDHALALGGTGRLRLRHVPVLDLATLVVDRHFRATQGRPSDPLFAGPDGRALKLGCISGEFVGLALRLGLRERAIGFGRLRATFLRAISESDDLAAVAEIRGVRDCVGGRRATSERVGEARLRAVLAFHPLAKLTRDMIRRTGPVARAVAEGTAVRLCGNPGKFPKLSTAARAALDAALRDGAPLPQDFRAAVLAAAAAGETCRDMAAHYGVPERQVYAIHEHGRIEQYAPALAGADLAKLLELMRQDPAPPRILADRLRAAGGTAVSLHQVRRVAKRNGIALRHGLRRRFTAEQIAAIETRIRTVPDMPAEEIVVWARRAFGMGILASAVEFVRIDLLGPHCALAPEAYAALRALVAANPKISGRAAKTALSKRFGRLPASNVLSVVIARLTAAQG